MCDSSLKNHGDARSEVGEAKSDPVSVASTSIGASLHETEHSKCLIGQIVPELDRNPTWGIPHAESMTVMTPEPC